MTQSTTLWCPLQVEPLKWSEAEHTIPTLTATGRATHRKNPTRIVLEGMTITTDPSTEKTETVGTELATGTVDSILLPTGVNTREEGAITRTEEDQSINPSDGIITQRTDTVTMTDISHPIAEKIAPRREDTTILTSTTEATVSKYRIQDQKYRIVRPRTSRLRPSATLPASLRPTRTRRRRPKRAKKSRKSKDSSSD